jgi:hypothetical protein
MAAVALSYKDLVGRAKEIIAGTLKDDGVAIHVEKAYQNRPAIVVVSRKFDGKTQKQRQDMLWPGLEDGLGPDATRISIIFARTWDEVK